MKYPNTIYARALVDALAGKSKEKRTEVFRNFAAILRRERTIARLPRIIGEAEKLMWRAAGVAKITCTTSDPLPERVRAEIQEAVGGQSQLEEIVDADMLAGVKILINDEILIDATAKRFLAHMNEK